MEKPKIRNLKMLAAIHKTVMDYSGNKELADSVWSHLRADDGKGVVAPPEHYRSTSNWWHDLWHAPEGQDGYSQI